MPRSASLSARTLSARPPSFQAQVRVGWSLMASSKLFMARSSEGIGSIPWSPLARGQLTRPWAEQTARSQSDRFSRTAYTDADRPIVEAVADLAAKRGVTPAQIALAWVLSNPVIDSPIVGATKPHHLTDAVAAVDLRLDESEVETLEKGYQPHPVIGVQIG